MAHKYPELINAAFLLHSIPLDGYKSYNENGDLMKPEDAAVQFAGLASDDTTDEAFYEMWKAFSVNAAGLPASDHKIFQFIGEGKLVQCCLNTANFNSDLSPKLV